MTVHSLFDKKRKQEIRDAIKRRDKGFFRRKKNGAEPNYPAQDDPLDLYEQLVQVHDHMKPYSETNSAGERHPTKYMPRQIENELLAAIRDGNLDMIKSAIQSGADITFVFPTDIIEERANYSKWYTENALGMSIRYGNQEVIDFLKRELVKASQD